MIFSIYQQQIYHNMHNSAESLCWPRNERKITVSFVCTKEYRFFSVDNKWFYVFSFIKMNRNIKILKKIYLNNKKKTFNFSHASSSHWRSMKLKAALKKKCKNVT